jgi:hypothetical protein
MKIDWILKGSLPTFHKTTQIMEAQQISIGDIVRHKHILQGTDLCVIEVKTEALQVRYAHQGMFQTQDLFLYEVELYVEDADEYL